MFTSAKQTSVDLQANAESSTAEELRAAKEAAASSAQRVEQLEARVQTLLQHLETANRRAEGDKAGKFYPFLMHLQQCRCPMF